MPDLDGGHYFLTVLAPVRIDPVKPVHPDVPFEETRSHVQRLAETLSLLPVGRQTAASLPDGACSPFARNTLNHTARITIIDSPNFNGRNSGDTVLNMSKNPLTAQPTDQLGTPYLLFAADIDSCADGETGLREYADKLWETMHEELTAIFGHCYGFNTVTDAAGFHAYLKRCQIETTLSFNDYWPEGMPAPKEWLKVKALTRVAKAVSWITLGWLLLLITAAALALTLWENGFVVFIGTVAVWGVIVVPGLILIVFLWSYWIYWRVLSHGRKPFPVAPGSDLPSVLKALFVQQAYTRFAIEAQGLDPVKLHARFGEFLAAVKPTEPQPALAAGECHAPDWAR